MNVNGKIIFILCLQALDVLSDVKWMPINDGSTLLSHEYSWLATMVYGNGSTCGYCGGAVINAQFVLTSAQCVTGTNVDSLGGLTGVRLGDYTKSSYCVYGTSNCNYYQEFGIAQIQPHRNYGPGNKTPTIRHDIALVRLNRTIQFEPIMRRVHLPHLLQPLINTLLTVSGWVLPISPKELTTNCFQRFKYEKTCTYEENMMWTGLLVAPNNNEKIAGGTYFGRHMVIEGIVSFLRPSRCGNLYIPNSYTRVANYLPWIENNSHINGSDNSTYISAPTPTIPPHNGEKEDDLPKSRPNTSVVYPFPTDCGYSPIYPRELIDSGYKIEPDEFSWIASLVYEKNNSAFGHCSGSVISAHYVLTTRNCVQNDSQLGKPIGVRLGLFDKESICDYGTENCQQYQYFPIEDTRVASSPEETKNNLALIKLDRDIEFGPRMKPVCLPFSENYIAPSEESFLTVAGWWTTTYPNDVIAKRSATVAFWNTAPCVEAALDKDMQVCGVKPGNSPCTVELGSPLMDMFERRRMVLEGIAYSGVGDCPGTDVGTLYTRVRSFKNWIESTVQELESKSKNSQITSQNQTQIKGEKGTNKLKRGEKTENGYGGDAYK